MKIARSLAAGFLVAFYFLTPTLAFAQVASTCNIDCAAGYHASGPAGSCNQTCIPDSTSSSGSSFSLPPTCTLTASQTSVPLGSTVNLKWTSYNASGGNITTIGSVDINGTQGVIPTPPSTTYVGTFTGPGGTGKCSVTVTIQGATGGSGGTGGTSGTSGGSSTGGTTNTGTTGTTGSTPGASTNTSGQTPTQTTVAPTISCPSGYSYTGGNCVSSSGSTAPNYSCPDGFTYQSITGPEGTTAQCVHITNPPQTPTDNGSSAQPMEIFDNSITAPAYQPGNTPAGSQPGLVPCGLSHDPIQATECNLCDVGRLIQNIINFLLGISIPIAIGMFAYAGILYFTATGDSEKITRAHHIFKSVLVGFIIALSAWLVVQVVINALMGDNFFTSGSWNTLSCADPNHNNPNARPRNDTISSIFTGIQGGGQAGQTAGQPQNNVSVVNSTGGLPSTISNTTLISSSQATGQYASQLCSLDSSNCLTEQAIMMNEDPSADPTKVTTATMQDGTTQSCVGLMQVCLGTARSLDPKGTAGLSDAALISKLQDPTYNMTLGSQLFNQCGGTSGGANAIACYNGGPGANAPSNDCGASVTKWACPKNPGNYKQTQIYVPNVLAAQQYLQANMQASNNASGGTGI